MIASYPGDDLPRRPAITDIALDSRQPIRREGQKSFAASGGTLARSNNVTA